MTKSEGIRVVTEMEAQRLLISHGYSKEVCQACKGVGHYVTGTPNDWKKIACCACYGQSWIWKEPTK